MAITLHAFALLSHSSTTGPTFNLTSAGPLKLVSDGTTAYGVAADDMVVVWAFHSGTATRTLAQMTPTDPSAVAYSAINSAVITASDTNVSSAAASYKFMGATPDASFTAPACAATTNSLLIAVLIFKGVDQTTPLAGVTPTTATGINGALPDNPSITTPASPSGCVMVGFGGQASDAGTAMTVPTTTPFDATARYTGVVSRTTATNNGSIGYGIKTGLGVSTAFNPSVWNGGQTTNTGSCGALSFILAPAVSTQTLTPSLFTNSQTFPVPTVSATNTLSPALFTNTQSFYSPTVSASYSLTPSLFTNSQIFYSPTVSQGFILSPSLLVNSQSFYSPTVTPGPVNISPSLLSAGGSIKLPAVLATNTLLPPLLTNINSFLSPTITTSYSLVAGLLNAGGSIQLPTVTSSYVLLPPLLVNSNSFPSPSIFRPLHVTAGNLAAVDLVWLGRVRPQVFVTPPTPPTAHLDDPAPPVHDTSRY